MRSDGGGCAGAVSRSPRGEPTAAHSPDVSALPGPGTQQGGSRGATLIARHKAIGFARVVALSVVALNIHRIGLLLRRKARRRRAVTALPETPVHS